MWNALDAEVERHGAKAHERVPGQPIVFDCYREERLNRLADTKRDMGFIEKEIEIRRQARSRIEQGSR